MCTDRAEVRKKGWTLVGVPVGGKLELHFA